MRMHVDDGHATPADHRATPRSLGEAVSSGGQTLRSISMAGTASNRRLTVPAEGMKCEFGHYFGQEGPEVASPGWKYLDLKVEMVPY